MTRALEFDVCQLTLGQRGFRKEQFPSSVKFVPMGIAEVTRLQQREGFAYVRP